jgi:hypothetical protein
MYPRVSRGVVVHRIFDSLDRLIACCDFAVGRAEHAFGQAFWLLFRVRVMIEILRWLHIDRLLGLCLSVVHAIRALI